MLQKNCPGFYKRLDNVHRYLIISGTAKWHIDDQIFEAEAGKLIHHPPSAGTVYLYNIHICIRTKAFKIVFKMT